MTTNHDTSRWRPAWWIGGFTLAWIAAVNGFAWWVIRGADIDVAELDAVGLSATDGYTYLGIEFTADSVLLFSVAAVVSTLIVSRDRSHRYGWQFGLTWAIFPTVMPVIGALLALSVGGVLPSSLGAWLALAVIAGFMVLLGGLLLSLALFPSGTFHARRWQRAFTAALGAWAAALVAYLLRPGDISILGEPIAIENPIGVDALSWAGEDLVMLVLLVLVLLTLASLVARYRAAGSVERHQLKWFLYAASLFLSTFVVTLVGPDWSGWVMTSGGALVIVAIGVAITKYRLYDIDIIINRSLVFVGLAAFITAIYVGIVVGIGSLFSGSDLWLSIAATALVAVVFEPVRLRLQKWANRLVYGSRATPYEVLSDLTGRLAETESEEGLLERMAQRLSEGTGAERAVVWLSDGTAIHAAAIAPSNGDAPTSSADFAALPGIAVPIEHEGETLGALSIEKARGDAVTPTEQQLMEDLAGSAGLVMRRLRLDEALAQKAEELEESRRRLLDAQDTERRRLERDLHDGAQQHVVALAEKLRLAGRVAADEGTEKATMFIEQMAVEAADAIDQIRSLAQGIYPPLLESKGLEAAIPTLAAQSPLDVEANVRVGSRHPLPLEGAVYFCVSEALTNASKHAEGPIQVTVTDAEGTLSFSVTDSGPGFDPTTVGRGAGLDNMADRLDALGGSLAIDSTPGGVTTVRGSLPIYANAE